MDYFQEAKNIIKSEIARKNMDYQTLALLLKEKGVEDNRMNIANKISRGKFSFAFALQILDALGVKNLRIRD
ncbi:MULTISPECIES: DUF6471 domain-containing protein [unclassified Campylobacter]|uniref:DUF6471 domain-containing protein n=1 Tax=unclassified Campylobacter TaxID=2593542 RepID=UPI0014739EEA|nr:MULTISPECIES: DUF6471 domain-containing protein [unclassified Campylobacter]